MEVHHLQSTLLKRFIADRRHHTVQLGIAYTPDQQTSLILEVCSLWLSASAVGWQGPDLPRAAHGECALLSTANVIGNYGTRNNAFL